MRIHGELWLRPREYFPSLLRGHVMGDHALRSLRSGTRPLEGFWSRYLVDQHVHASCIADEILRYASVSGEHHRATRMVNPVPECRLDRYVIKFKRSDFHSALLVHDAFANILREDHHPVR